MWIFIDEEGFPLKKGDFFRIPRNAVHWSWNRSDKPCTFFKSMLLGFPSIRFSRRSLDRCSATAKLPQVIGHVINSYSTGSRRGVDRDARTN